MYPRPTDRPFFDREVPSTGRKVFMTRRRIAYFGSSTAVDAGSELCLLRMVRRFHETDEATLFLPDEGPLFERARESGIDAVNLSFLRLRKRRGWDWVRWRKSRAEAAVRLEAEIRKRGLQLVHFNDVIDAPFYSIPKKAGIPAVSHVRLILGSAAGRALYRAVVRRAGVFVIPVSSAVERAMPGRDAAIRRESVYDPRPDPEAFRPSTESDGEERNAIRRNLGWSDQDFVVAMVSKLLENKGHLNFIAAAKELERRCPDRYRFLMIAGAAEGRELYRKRVEKAREGLPPYLFRWLPGARHAELPRYLRAADLLLHLPDTEDSFPGVVLEGMASGLPVAAYRAGGIPEQLDDGRAGILVPRGDIGAAADAVETLFGDKERRTALREAALERLGTEFTAERFFEALDGIYRRLIGER